jgi:hypothetical protein
VREKHCYAAVKIQLTLANKFKRKQKSGQKFSYHISMPSFGHGWPCWVLMTRTSINLGVESNSWWAWVFSERILCSWIWVWLANPVGVVPVAIFNHHRLDVLMICLPSDRNMNPTTISSFAANTHVLGLVDILETLDIPCPAPLRSQSWYVPLSKEWWETVNVIEAFSDYVFSYMPNYNS